MAGCILPLASKRIWRRIVAALICAFIVCSGAAPAFAQQPPLRVAVHENPPFVVEEKGHYSGMAIELWEMFAKELGLKFNYLPYETVREMVDATAKGEVDVAVTNLTITEARAQRIEFTQPWFDSGLRIMVHDDSSGSFWDLLRGLRDSGFLGAYAWLGFVILLATVGYTMFDRHFDRDFPKRWRDGLAESFYSVMTIATSGKPAPRRNLFGWYGRVWQGVWLVFGVLVVAFVTSSVTSVMTTLSLRGDIHNVGDLSGRIVGVTEGSTAEDVARAARLAVVPFPNIRKSADALLAGRIDAVVGDKPVLEYFAYKNPEKAFSVVGPLFNPDKYGFGLPPQSPLRKPLTVEVVGAHEDGMIHRLYIKYFGGDN
ncbi:transporter substrate-binding domain-containing protein [Nitratireductor kimnyeongensis]|uniref:Transporter substrate-binding domain-containing protein n=1 Tax=Nitratireductor kimnyeongensis TaxID=430679 RepID=A0ABW0TBN6_9HYPH|nr:transporter substrate-binding domain-containing protein [Nitratireductor kimnyeongensis]QZZ36939.1 transporter substrate-binding domain-containing protein [Nitratireductor kimnyeongensis]